MYNRLSDYSLIGNCRSSALVSKWGSIDWACLPDVDSDAYFCRILDDKKGGFFSINPTGFYQSSQIYKEKTNILKIDFFNHTGRVTLTDYMPVSKEQEKNGDIPKYGLKFCRRIKAKVGNHKIKLELKVTPDFAQASATVEQRSGEVRFISDKGTLTLLGDMSSIDIKGNLAFCEFDLLEGEEKFFFLTFYKSENEVLETNWNIFKKTYQETLSFWQWWSNISRYRGIFSEQINRSALALKLLTFAPTGAVVAAPTTSLPEKIGSHLNWDYRYVWLRDASFTMYAFLGLGYLKEAVDFMNWLTTTLNTDARIQIMYGVRGERHLLEKEFKNLSGYENSKPVRIGNAAHSQKQLDIFGEVMICISLFIYSGGEATDDIKSLIVRMVNESLQSWGEKDSGIWEPRHGLQHHTYSKVMCWVALDRGLRLAKKLKLDLDQSLLKSTIEKIRSDVLSKGYNKELGAFVDFYGSNIIDSSNLNIPLVGFLPASDPKVLSTLELTLSQLTKDWFVYRTNDESDSLKEGEGAFFLSIFWLIDTLAILGRTKEATIWLEKLIYFSTPTGLYAEEFNPKFKEHLGNYPQAFTHLGLINSILNLNKALKKGAEMRVTIPAERLLGVKDTLGGGLQSVFESVIPLFIRKQFRGKSLRQTQKHSLIGKALKQLSGEND